MATLSTISTSVIDRFKKNESTLDTAFVYNDSGTLEGKGGCWYTDKNSLGDNADVPAPTNDYVVFQIGMRNKGDRTQFYCDGNNFSKRQVDNTSDDAFSEWVQQNKAVLLESYKSGATFYRKYSDGWIEQGGKFTGATPASSTKTISFYQAFSDTNYKIFVQPTSNDTSNNTLSVQYGHSYYGTIVTKSTSSFQGRGSASTDWYACGY